MFQFQIPSTINTLNISASMMDPQADRMSTKSGSTFPRSSHHSQRTASIMSRTSHYTQNTQGPPAQPQALSIAPSHTGSTTTLVASPTNASERYWNPEAQESGGHRTEAKTPRGVVSSAGAAASQWLLALEVVLQHNFQNPDLLEEALESPGSGVVVVKRSNRVCIDGNEGLARVGQAVMKLILRDQCYLFKVPEKDMDPIVDKIIGWRNLDKLGRRTKIEKMIRPREPVRARRKHNVLSLLKDDAQRESPTRTIARAIRAIIGAVYYDGGYQAARRVLSQMNLIIKPPES